MPHAAPQGVMVHDAFPSLAQTKKKFREQISACRVQQSTCNQPPIQNLFIVILFVYIIITLAQMVLVQNGSHTRHPALV